MIAALFVASNGHYFNLPGIDPWDESRDARKYKGPHPVIAHPPCARWGRYYAGQPGNPQFKRGDDDGCFKSALLSVRRFGGVLEHPMDSSAWSWHGLKAPPRSGGWIQADTFGWTCCVEQGHYGHRARKPSWLYLVAPSVPDLIWGPSTPAPSVNSTPGNRRGVLERMSKKQRLSTPEKFRDLLIDLVRPLN